MRKLRLTPAEQARLFEYRDMVLEGQTTLEEQIQEVADETDRDDNDTLNEEQ